MFEYERDPKHPCAHPLYDDSLVEKPVYDPETLTPAQLKYEERRVKRREMMKAKRLAEEEEFRKNNYQVIKVHKRYAPRNALITPHDFDGIPEYCTECDAPLWGTQYVLPLWKKFSLKLSSPYLTYPFCEGCSRLFSKKYIKSLADKYKLILWMLTGEATNLEYDIPFNQKNYRIAEVTMTKRANVMHTHTPLYNHKDWFFLKTKDELMFEYKNKYPNDSKDSIKEKIKHFIKRDPFIKVMTPKPIKEAGTATVKRLERLVYEQDGRDALLGHKCYIHAGNAYNGLTFDHLEPCSTVRYIDGSYSIGNIQILSHCLNNIKGSYTEKEIVRWLARILETYEESYGNSSAASNYKSIIIVTIVTIIINIVIVHITKVIIIVQINFSLLLSLLIQNAIRVYDAFTLYPLSFLNIAWWFHLVIMISK